jgi:hypothetical protein
MAVEYVTGGVMIVSRALRAAAASGWIAMLTVAWTWTAVAAGEVHCYREVAGASVRDIIWQLDRTDRYTLVSLSPGQRHTTTTTLDYDTLCWQVIDHPGQTDLTANRKDETIVIHGRYKGQPIDKTLRIDRSPWYQATSLSLRGLVASDDDDRVFWTIRMKTLTAHKVRAVKKGIERIASGESTEALQRIQLRATGLLAPFWKSDYWFSRPHGWLYRFQAPSGPPGSPMTTVTRITPIMPASTNGIGESSLR